MSRTSAAVERCEASGQATAPFGTSPAERYHLVKNWDFRRGIRDEATLRAEFETRYVYDGGRLDHLGDEWSRYREHDNHVFTPNGLALVARVDGEPAPGKIESGMLRSRWTGRYGVFEICMRAPEGKGLWPAFWLNPEDGRWPPEIDVVEIVNDRGPVADRSFHFLHGKGVGAAAPGSRLDAEGAYPANPDYSRAFHLFSVEWSPSRVRHLVDGVRVADREFRWIHDDGSDAGPAHVLVNLAVGGHWAGVPSDPAIFPAALEVAFMRVWQR
ncbi:MAG TPA: glycoside hydrolase family 16 protein [Polyangiaceae bacterium]|nr:glycoside hydrolase family 16 protein [Polyangiaceae bacterium]